MKHPFIPVIVMASFAMISNAQSSKSTKPPQQDGLTQAEPDYVGLRECIGAKVSMNPGAEALGDAADDDKPASRPIGELDDFVIASRTGRMEWAVVSFGGLLGIGDKTVAVPCANLQWNAAARCFDLDVSQDHLVALKAFDLGKARAADLEDAMLACAANWRAVVAPASVEKTAVDARAVKKAADDKRADKPVLAIAGTTMVADTARMICASEVDDYPLYARGEEFGKVDDCVIDRANGTLALVIVGHGGTLGFGKDAYLLPFTALRLARKGDAAVFVVDKSATEMAACVEYEKPAKGIVDAEAARRCRATVDGKAAIGSEDAR